MYIILWGLFADFEVAKSAYIASKRAATACDFGTQHASFIAGHVSILLVAMTVQISEHGQKMWKHDPRIQSTCKQNLSAMISRPWFALREACANLYRRQTCCKTLHARIHYKAHQKRCTPSTILHAQVHGAAAD